MKILVGCAAAVVLLVAGCATTEQTAMQEQLAVCAFLGDVCHQLKPGQEGEAGLRWVNPKAQMTQYKSVMINMVGFFGSDPSKVPPKDQQALTDYFAKALHEELAKKYQIVEQAGPEVVKIQVAILDAEATTPGMRPITMTVPQMRLMSTRASVVTEEFPFPGGATAAAKLTDSVTGGVLAAGVDRRMGGGSFKTVAQWRWGDAEDAMRAWAEQIATQLYSRTSGEKKP